MNNFKRVPLIARITLLALVAFGVMTLTARASSALPPTIIDDFEDGDTSDWSFFGGNAAGGALVQCLGAQPERRHGRQLFAGDHPA